MRMTLSTFGFVAILSAWGGLAAGDPAASKTEIVKDWLLQDAGRDAGRCFTRRDSAEDGLGNIYLVDAKVIELLRPTESKQ